jgi:hypothetical protein
MAKGSESSIDKEQEFPLLENNQEHGDYEDDDVEFTKPPPARRGINILFQPSWKYGFITISLLIPLYFLYYVIGSFFFGKPAPSGLPTALRPTFHFATPPETWLNDPNGLFLDSDNLWHMYYQRE